MVNEVKLPTDEEIKAMAEKYANESMPAYAGYIAGFRGGVRLALAAKDAECKRLTERISYCHKVINSFESRAHDHEPVPTSGTRELLEEAFNAGYDYAKGVYGAGYSEYPDFETWLASRKEGVGNGKH